MKIKKSYTEQVIDSQLDRMIFLAAQEKLLPKIIYDYSQSTKSPKFAHSYQQSVKQIYSKQTAVPSKYSEDEAKSHRQKFRQKVIKLVNNQLPIEYLKPVKLNGHYVMTFNGHPLEKVQYITKAQHAIFKDYNETKFKEGFHQIFQDSLQYTQKQLISNPRKDLAIRNKTQPNSLSKITPTARPQRMESSHYLNIRSSDFNNLIPNLLPKIAMKQLDRSKLLSPKALQKQKPKWPKDIKQDELLLQTMMRIGKYSTISPQTASVTKESILKYFKQFYPRPHRIVDFLEFSDVQSYQTFFKIPHRLRFMPNQHILFMAFLFYDTNNDGYICHNDLLRLEEISKKCPLLLDDIQVIRQGALKIKYQNKLAYLDLYRLSQITETVYFQWLKKDPPKETKNPEDQSYGEELKSYFQILNKRKIQIHFEGFKKLFQNGKPFLYYDLVWRISGIKYDGLKYQ